MTQSDQPGIDPGPDTIEPDAPAEMPLDSIPDEGGPGSPDEIEPPVPDTDDPGRSPIEEPARDPAD